MHYSDTAHSAQPRESGFEFQSLVDRFLNERFDRFLTPRAKRPTAKSAPETPDTCKPDSLDLDCVAVTGPRRSSMRKPKRLRRDQRQSRSILCPP